MFAFSTGINEAAEWNSGNWSSFLTFRSVNTVISELVLKSCLVCLIPYKKKGKTLTLGLHA